MPTFSLSSDTLHLLVSDYKNKIKNWRHYRAPQELTTKTTDTLSKSQYDESSIFCSPEIFDLILRLMIRNPKAMILKLRNDMDIQSHCSHNVSY